jgi:Carboxypeptidase regulatory-like domain
MKQALASIFLFPVSPLTSLVTQHWLFTRRLLLPLLGIFLAATAFASGPTGTITGTVTDPSGAVVPKARISVRNEATNAVRSAGTNDDGDFTIALLPPGRYQVTAEGTGFRKSIFSDVTVDVDQTVRADFALEVGAATEEVRVKDTPPAIQTDTSTLGQVVNDRLVQQLPLNERNFLNFALLVPGSQLPAEGSQNSTQGGALSVNGARSNRTISCSTASTTTIPTSTNTSLCRRWTRFKSSRFNPAIIQPSMAVAAAPRSTWC